MWILKCLKQEYITHTHTQPPNKTKPNTPTQPPALSRSYTQIAFEPQTSLVIPVKCGVSQG